MENYKIVWGPEREAGGILVRLFDPMGTEIDWTWIPADETEDMAEYHFRVEGSLPESEMGHVAHEHKEEIK